MTSILAAPCHVAEGSAVGAAVGRVTDRAAGEALPGVPLTATWPVPGAAEPGRAATVSDDNGGYRFCELPAGVTARIVARLEADSATAEVQPARGMPQQRDLAVAAPAELLARRPRSSASARTWWCAGRRRHRAPGRGCETTSGGGARADHQAATASSPRRAVGDVRHRL